MAFPRNEMTVSRKNDNSFARTILRIHRIFPPTILLTLWELMQEVIYYDDEQI